MTPSENMDDNEQNIRKMAIYLKKGAKMLDLACPVCNNPIFQLKDGRKYCVVCEKPVLFEWEYNQANKELDVQHKNVKETLNETKELPLDHTRFAGNFIPNDIKPNDFKINSNFVWNDLKTLYQVREIILNEILNVSLKLKECTDLEVMDKTVDLLLKLLVVLKKIQETRL
ncbi:MAG: Sjogren's syndrome/scleroderma autoantigen 1 family protein [Promethearchaeota archaeon]